MRGVAKFLPGHGWLSKVDDRRRSTASPARSANGLRVRLRCESPRSAPSRPDFLDQRINTSAIRKEGCVDLLSRSLAPLSHPYNAVRLAAPGAYASRTRRTTGRGVARGGGRESGRIFRFLAQAPIPAFADSRSLRSTPHARSVARKFHILVTGSIIGAEEGCSRRCARGSRGRRAGAPLGSHQAEQAQRGLEILA